MNKYALDENKCAPSVLALFFATAIPLLFSNITFADEDTNRFMGYHNRHELAKQNTILLVANGIYALNDPDFTPPDYQVFVSFVMNWSDSEANDFRQEAKTFFMEKFGVDVDAPEFAGRALMVPFMLDPRWEYRMYQGPKKRRIPKRGFVARDGGFQLVAIDPNGIVLGGEFEGRHVAQGSVAAFGIYNIKVSRFKNIILRYQSREPVLQNNGFPLRVDDKGVLIAPFDVFHDKFGHGWGFAHIWNVFQDDNESVQTNIRNVITFPAGASFPDRLSHHSE